MMPGSIVWASVTCTFTSLVPLFNWAGFFPKPFPNPAFLKEIPRIVNTRGFWILCLLILHKLTDKRAVYALGKLAINLFSCMIWVSVMPYLGTSKSIVFGSWSCDLLGWKKQTPFYTTLQNLVSFKIVISVYLMQNLDYVQRLCFYHLYDLKVYVKDFFSCAF